MVPYIFLCSVVMVLAITMVVPTLRVWRRYGTWPVVFQREADPFQRLMGAVMGSLLGGILIWAGLFVALGPSRLGLYSLPFIVTIVGWMAIGLGALTVIVAQVHMGASWRIGIDDRPTDLVTSGLYGLVRNPIFAGLLLSVLGFVLITPAPWTIMGFAAICVLICLQVRLEEQHLLRVHGEQYQGYAAQVGRFVPLLGRLHPSTTTIFEGERERGGLQ